MPDERLRVDQGDNNPGAGRSSESLDRRVDLQMTPGDIQLTPSEAGNEKILIFIVVFTGQYLRAPHHHQQGPLHRSQYTSNSPNDHRPTCSSLYIFFSCINNKNVRDIGSEFICLGENFIEQVTTSNGSKKGYSTGYFVQSEPEGRVSGAKGIQNFERL